SRYIERSTILICSCPITSLLHQMTLTACSRLHFAMATSERSSSPWRGPADRSLPSHIWHRAVERPLECVPKHDASRGVAANPDVSNPTECTVLSCTGS